MTFPDSITRNSHMRTRRHLRGLIARALVFFADHEADTLHRIREHLLTVMDSRTSLEQAQNLRSAFVLLDRQSKAFNQAFRTAVQTTIDEEALLAFPDAQKLQVTKRSPPDHPLDGMSLSLIGMNEVDQILLLDRVTERFNTHFDPSLTPLTNRLSALLNLNAPSLSRNPFRPEVFIRSFLTAWEHCDLDPRATNDLMLTLDPQHSVDLSSLYCELDKVLALAGVADQPALRIKRDTAESSDKTAPSPSLPTRSPSVTRYPTAGQAFAAPAMHPVGRPLASSQNSAWQALAPVGRNMATQAREFLRRLGFSTEAAPQTRGLAPRRPDALVYASGMSPASHDAGDESEFMGSLSPEVFEMGLQTRTTADPEFMGYLGNLQAGEVAIFAHSAFTEQNPVDRNVLRQMRDMEQVRRAPELDRGTVDALAEVFDFVFADQTIPAQMKFVIGRLQIPVLKAAMIDRDFFLSAEHPARRLVDTLAQASIAWAPEKGKNDPLYTRIEYTVQRVLNEFEDDLNLFRDLLQRFNEFLFETEQQAQGRIEPAADQERSDEAFDEALARADEMVHIRISARPRSRPLVNFLLPFLTQQWREVLARAWLQSDAGSLAWESALTTMDQLIWSTQPKTESEERLKLVRSLNEGLDAIEWNGPARAKFTRRLITAHTLAIRMTQGPSEDTASAALDERDGQQAMQELDARLANQLSESRDMYDAMAQSFTRGTWFDFNDDSGLQHRCRLSWVSPIRTRMLFTNREGFDAFVRSEREVAALLRHKRLCVIDQTPIVARALGHIMASDSEALAA
jgi:hypothetical protein